MVVPSWLRVTIVEPATAGPDVLPITRMQQQEEQQQQIGAIHA
jgi:hypothetical protein